MAFFRHSHFTTMSVEQEIKQMIQDAHGVQDTQVSNALARTVEEVNNLLKATNVSLLDVCEKIENASTKQGLMKTLRQFDKVMRFFLEVAKKSEHQHLVVQAVCSLTEPVFSGLARVGLFIAGGYYWL